ncbi:MAG: amino acid permease [Bryobacterales bacterium]|nr:amino acid permease [Bryobacterales bacterium]
MAIVLGIIVGAGIFALPSRVAQYASTFLEVIPLWAGAGVISMMGALIYAELGTRFPNTGGEYVYLRHAFGTMPAFLYGWAQLLVIRTNPGATLALVFAEYASSFVPMNEPARIALAAMLIWTLGAANYVGLEIGKKVQLITTLAKVAGMLLLAAAGIALGLDWENLSTAHRTASSDELSNFTGAMLLVAFAYLGWDRLGNVAGEMKNPSRDLPRVLVLSLLIVIVLYLILNLVIHSALGMDALSKTRAPAADVAAMAMGPVGGVLLAVIVMTATASSINATILSSSRVYYAMAKDGLLPEPVSRIHPRFRTPHVAVMAHCGWATVLLVGYRSLEALIGSQVFSMAIWYGVMAIGYLRIRSRSQERPPFLAPFYPLMPWMFIGALAVLAVATAIAKPFAAIGNILLILSGGPVYLVARRHALSANRAADASGEAAGRH